MNINIEPHNSAKFVEKFGKLITEALLLDFLQPIRLLKKELLPSILTQTNGSETINYLIRGLLNNNYQKLTSIYHSYKNVYLAALAPLSNSNISCSCMLVGKFNSKINQKNFPLGINLGPNYTEPTEELHKLKAKYLLLGLLLNCMHHSLHGNGTGSCNTEFVFLRNDNTYYFYFKYLEKLKLDVITMDYINSNTGRQLTKIIFNLNDICNKMLSPDFDVNSISEILFYNLKSNNIPDLYIGLNCYLELFKENTELFSKAHMHVSPDIKLPHIQNLINKYTDKIVLANTELLVE